MVLKQCTRCGQEKDRREFHRDARKPDGRRPECAKCASVSNKKRYDRDREYYREYKRQVKAGERKRKKDEAERMASVPRRVGSPAYHYRGCKGQLVTAQDGYNNLIVMCWRCGAEWPAGKHGSKTKTDEAIIEQAIAIHDDPLR